jgi:hypothetical protein
MGHLIDQYVRIVIVTIGAVTVTNAIINYRGTVEVGKLIFGLPVQLAESLRR